MAPERIGPYRILGTLGEGGMGAVYEAMNESIERRVALKVLHTEYAHSPEAVTRFFNEARAVNRIEHPNIVQVSEFGQADDGTVYLVMEFLRGTTLGQWLEAKHAAGTAVRAADVMQIAAQLADALSAAHDKGIVHRDMKPGNVMLIDDPLQAGGLRVKLLDFGIAKLTQGAKGGAKATTTNALMGTPQYMSPEQCRGAGGVDERTDVYSLGVILYEMLAGRPPFSAEDPLGYLTQHAYQPPPPLAGLARQAPPELVALVHRMLVKDKTTRPAMREIRTELVGLLSHRSGASRAVDPPLDPAGTRLISPAAPSTLGGSLGQTLGPKPRRRTTIFVAVGLGMLLSGGMAVRLLSNGPSKSGPSAAAIVPPRAVPSAPPPAPAPATVPEASPPPVATPPPVRKPVPQPAEPIRRPPAHPVVPAPRPRPTPPASAASPSPAAPVKRPARFVD